MGPRCPKNLEVFSSFVFHSYARLISWLFSDFEGGIEVHTISLFFPQVLPKNGGMQKRAIILKCYSLRDVRKKQFLRIYQFFVIVIIIIFFLLHRLFQLHSYLWRSSLLQPWKRPKYTFSILYLLNFENHDNFSSPFIVFGWRKEIGGPNQKLNMNDVHSNDAITLTLFSFSTLGYSSIGWFGFILL